MRNVLAVLIANGAEFGRAEIEVLSAGSRLAADLGGTSVAAVVGGSDQSWAREAFSYGAVRVYVAGSPALTHYEPRLFADALEQIARSADADVLLFSSTISGLEVAPLVGYKLGASVIMDVTGIDGKVEGGGVRIQKPVFGGKAQSELVAQKAPVVLSLRMRSVDPLQPQEGASGEVIEIPVNVRPSTGTWRLIERNLEKSGGPRLEDARFFYNQDRKRRLEERVPQLARVIYHNKLGSQLERVERVQLLAGSIARRLGADAEQAARAAWLAKADLLTNMVGEFPELQGVMGQYYALADGEDARVAEAVEQHYRPRFAGDALPSNEISVAVALADKIETLIGMFGVGQRPTGDRDPFALRRHALGIVRILVEKKLPIDLDPLLKEAQDKFPPGKLTVARVENTISIPLYADVSSFVQERAKSYLRDQDYSASEVESVLSLSGAKPSEYIGRLNAVRLFLSLTEAIELAESDKRIRNIINKSAAASIISLINEEQFVETAEKQLFKSVRTLRPQVDSLIRQGNFEQALLLTAQVHLPVKQFFDEVMVNVEDEAIRSKRFALLHEVSNLTNRVANLSELVIKA